ncbi:MAG: efflux RND transporter periplasmic adaptor subunit [Leptospiraceae bacterium]|nr:efflux RND transporter periplasmic adaptor subunit [Leptospiraceae bacterium]MCP5498481.1 efflux RND transporter periplasmic adaptor subunit [Leptospiraceae bacterium]
MSKKLFIIYLILIPFFFSTACKKKAQENTSSKSEEKHEHKHEKELYTCPMHPEVIRDKKGTCPICKMDLVPLKKQEMNLEDTKPDSKDKIIIHLEPATIQKVGVVTELVKKKTIEREIRTVAHIDFDESAETIINSRVNGWVEKLYVKFTGQTVRKGQALIGIYSPELVSTQEEYLKLYKSYNSASDEGTKKELSKLLESSKRRLLNWNISKGQILELEKKQEVQRLMNLYSPYSGVVVEKKVIEGAKIMEGMDLFKLANLETVWAFVHIPEKDIPFIKENMPAKILLPQLPTEEFQGKVSFIFPYIEMKSRDLKVRVSIPNRDFKVKPGMYATIVLEQKLEGEHIVIPSSAVIRTGIRELIFVYHGKGKFEAREIKTGVPDGIDRVQVLKGLKEQEAIAVSGQFLLDSETKLQEAVRKMQTEASAMPEGGHSH